MAFSPCQGDTAGPAAVRRSVFTTAICSPQQAGSEASSPGSSFRGLWGSQEEHAGTQLCLCLSFLCALMERAIPCRLEVRQT